MPLQIGIFGGTFDPPHIGHLIVATHARRALGLDLMKLVVANDPWQKSGASRITAARHRLAMAERAVSEFAGLEVSSAEIDRGGPSYTIDTVYEELAAGADSVAIVVGRDAAGGLDTWHRHEELRELVTVVVVDRPGAEAEPPPGWQIRYVSVPQVDVSSTDLRRRLVDGDPVDVLIPPAVVAHIEDEELYTPPM